MPFTWSGSVHPISEECITKNALIGCFMYHFKEGSSLMVQSRMQDTSVMTGSPVQPNLQYRFK